MTALTLEKYEVLLRHRGDASRWSLMFDAESFSHAEEQALDFMKDDDSMQSYEIIRIERDYG